MRENRKITVSLIVLNAVCAAIWGILAISDIVEGKNMSLFILHIVCAVLWTLISIMNYIRYRKEHNAK